MKKLLISLLICTILFFPSCSNKNIDNDTYVQTEDDYFQYEINTPIYDYDIDVDNNLYYISSEVVRYETAIGEDGKEFSFPVLENHINVMDPKGVLKTYTTLDRINRLCIVGDRVVYISDTLNGLILYKFNTGFQTSEKICELTDYTKIMKLEAYGDKLYFIGNNKYQVDKEYSLADLEDSYNYAGERIGYIDLNTGNLEELPVEFPIAFSKTLDNNLLIYTYDEEKGYYFTVYDTNKKSLSENKYHDLGNLMNFDIFNDKNEFIYLKLQSSSMALTVSSPDAAAGENELIPKFSLTAMFNIKCKGDYTYCTDGDGKNIIRIKNSTYFRDNAKINMITMEYGSYYTPFGCGYKIQQDEVTDEEMALALLSQNTSFDICSMNSIQEISTNIRNKGSFYPLNDVKGVKEYLDACFPYIKETATNEEGDIWMLPIYVDIPYLLYNEELCKNNGIELSNNMNIDYFNDVLSKVRQDSNLKDMYYFSNGWMVKNFLYQYIRSFNNFNNTFTNFAESCKADFNYIVNWDYGNSDLFYNVNSKKDNNFLFFTVRDQNYHNTIADNEVIRACKNPRITEENTSVATCYYLTVNPASKNLKSALQYITSLSKYLLTVNDFIMLKNRGNYLDTQVMDDLYEIYSNGDIQFTFPNELYLDDFEKYLAGEKDLDSMINDSNRRLDTFLNE